MTVTFQRTPAVPLKDLPGSLPRANIDEKTDLVKVTSAALAQLSRPQDASFTDYALWRDLWSLTDDIRTFSGPKSIIAAWDACASIQRPSTFALVPGSAFIMRAGPQYSWVQARFTFETDGKGRPSDCSGTINIVPDEAEPSRWKISLLVTILEQIKGYPNPDIAEPKPTTIEATQGTRSAHGSVKDPYDCVIVGAGYSGLALAGRLKVLGLQCLVLDRNGQLGDNWLNRYDSVKLHTGKEYSQMPLGRTFDSSFPYFLKGKDLAEGYKKFVKYHDLDVSLQTTLQHAKWDKVGKTWTLEIEKAGEAHTIKARHLVLAIGGGGTVPKMPELPGKDQFKGDVLHSVDWKSGRPWKGKAGIIIGSANTAHDVAEDMLEAGLSSTTMIQRDRTLVVPISHFRAWTDASYTETASIEEADRASLGLPTKIAQLMGFELFRPLIQRDAARFDALEAAGFRLDRETDIQVAVNEKLGGHYMDVGCSDKIVRGLVKVKSNVKPVSYTPTGLRFSDGTTLDADVIVFCTGFEGNMRLAASQLVDQEVADGLDNYWGLDEEGNIRGAWRVMGHPNIWFTGGAIPLARFYSRFLALQILADVKGVPMEPYGRKSITK